ncbi:MAG: hypothetical protein H0W88_10640 [Parachlamydiaceae bacterium]|nr:hypothetical protein [Parachlamydiaceae bacterium]
MTSTAPSNIWTDTQNNLEQINANGYISARIKKNSIGFTIGVFEWTLEGIWNDLTRNFCKQLFQKFTKDEFESSKWQSPVPYEDSLSFNRDSSRKRFVVEINTKNFGLKKPDQIERFKAAITKIQTILSNFPKFIHCDNFSSLQDEWLSVFKKSMHEFRVARGYKLLHESVCLSDADREFLKLNPKDDSKEKKETKSSDSDKSKPLLLVQMDKIDCVCYALLRVREPQAIDWILEGSAPEDFFKSDPMKYFSKWGYEAIPADKASSGDLVAYLNVEVQSFPTITHLSIITTSGLLESKMGWNIKSVYLHRADNNAYQFGYLIICLHKNK